MIRTSFCTIAFQRDKWGAGRVVERHLPEVLPILAEAGYDGAELWGPHVMDLPDAQLDEVGRLLVEGGLEAAMVSPYFDFTTSDETAARSVAEGLRAIEIARRLGARGVRCFTGRAGSAEASDRQWRRAVAGLRELADAAERHARFLACETHRGNLMDTVDSSIELMRRVARPNVGLIFQPGTFRDHYLQAAERLAPYARHVHASNGGRYLGDGEMDYRCIVEVLRRHGFDGYISVEWMGDAPAAAAAHEAQYLRDLLGR
jgi:sugar phosphate isomerase/epimerase